MVTLKTRLGDRERGREKGRERQKGKERARKGWNEERDGIKKFVLRFWKMN